MVALFWFTIRQNMRLRKLWFVLLLLAGPSGLALLIRHFEPAVRPEFVRVQYHAPMVFMLFMIALPLVCMLYGSSLIGSEVDGRTLVFLITRRMRRETVLLVRFAAVSLLLIVLVGLAAVAMHLCRVAGLDIARLNAAANPPTALAWNPRHDLLSYLQAIPFAVTAFLAVFTLISLVIRRPLIVSLIYLACVEMGVSNIPVGAQIYTISHQIRRMLNSSIPGLIDTIMSHEFLRLIRPFYPPDLTGTLPLVCVTLAALGLACVAMRYRELGPSKTGRE